MPDNTRNIPVIIGRKIRVERVKQGISQEKLAEISGLHRTYIGMVERGEKNITLLNYVRIATALNVPLHEMTLGLSMPSLTGDENLVADKIVSQPHTGKDKGSRK
jgi:transcriptional regulator with XRE-family HTH domain